MEKHLMNNTYTKQTILGFVASALKAPATLYAQGFVNYRGKTSDERYTEIVAAQLLSHIGELQKIPPIPRENYKTDSHEELAKAVRPENTNRDEEWIAKGLYGKTFAHIGKIIDFQTPLKSIQTDDAGKIDLLSFDGANAHLLELKKPRSDETLLRCVLEIFTYWKTVECANLLTSFGLSAATPIRKAALVFADSQAYRDFHDVKGNAKVRELMKVLKVDFAVLAEDENSITEYVSA
jgi:hypothetical protein